MESRDEHASAGARPRKLRILHVFRAPLGGLFRHVIDLAAEQVARGHHVGLFFDSESRGDHIARGLSRITGGLSLGVSGCPIHRNPHPGDMIAIARFMKKVGEIKPDIVHGHGSKGGLYARLPGLLRPAGGPVRAYTPHGGSFNYKPGSLMHRAFMATEKLLTRSTDVFLFESAYIAGRYDALVGVETGLRRVVANGVSAAEFAPVAPNPDAADFLYVGELRAAKGIDTLLEAIALAGSKLGAVPRAVLVGSGPDKDILIRRARGSLASPIGSPFPARCRCGTPSNWGGSWLCPRAPNRYPMSCWRRRARVCRWFRRMSGEFRKYSAPIAIGSAPATIPPTSARACWR